MSTRLMIFATVKSPRILKIILLASAKSLSEDDGRAGSADPFSFALCRPEATRWFTNIYTGSTFLLNEFRAEYFSDIIRL